MKENIIMEIEYESDEIPTIYCAIAVCFADDNDALCAIKQLAELSVKTTDYHKPKVMGQGYFDIACIKNKPYWYLDDALKDMFAMVDHCLPQICGIIKQNRGEPFIDIAFYHDERYPAFEFKGENMRKIRMLEADISIDAY